LPGCMLFCAGFGQCPTIHGWDLSINRDQRRVERNGRRIELTPREYAILDVMMRNAGRPVSRAALLDEVWNMSSDSSTNIVDVYMKYVRDKIDLPGESKLTIQYADLDMSCAFLNCSETCGGSEGSETSPFACPYAGLANGLHAMAQPLTVLRGALGAWKLRSSLAGRTIGISICHETGWTHRRPAFEPAGCPGYGGWRTESREIDIGELTDLVLEDMNSDLREWASRLTPSSWIAALKSAGTQTGLSAQSERHSG